MVVFDPIYLYGNECQKSQGYDYRYKADVLLIHGTKIGIKWAKNKIPRL